MSVVKFLWTAFKTHSTVDILNLELANMCPFFGVQDIVSIQSRPAKASFS